MRARLSLLLAAVFTLSACQKGDDPVSRGQAYFDYIGCAKCHRVGGSGGVLGPDLTTVGFRHSREWLDVWLKDPKKWRKDSVMQKFNLPDDVRADVVAYLAAQKGQAWGEKRPWNEAGLADNPVKRGEVLFNRAGCVACHAEKGRGGYPNNNVVGNQIPSLQIVSKGYNKAELKNRIAGGVTPIPADPKGPAPMIQMPKWGEFLKDDELEAVAAFLMSLGSGGKKEDAAF